MTPDQHAAAEQAAILAARGIGAVPHQMSVGPADVHIDTALSDLAVHYRPNAGKFIADLVAPVITVGHRTNKFFKFAPGTYLDLAKSDIASQMGRPAQVSTSLSNDSYIVRDHGFTDFVPADVETTADAPLRPLMDATEILTERLYLSREFRIATAFADTANFGSQTSDLTGAEWSLSGSNPIKAIEDAIESMVIDPDTLTLGPLVWNALRRHPAMERYVLSRASTASGATPLVVTPELVAQAFGLRQVLVGKAKYNSANPGATFAQAHVWGRIAVLSKAEPRPAAQRTENFMYTFRFRAQGGSAFETRQWFDHSIGVRGGTWVKTTHSDAEKVTAQEAGFLFYNCVPA